MTLHAEPSGGKPGASTHARGKRGFTEFKKEDCPVCKHRGWCAKADDGSVIICRRQHQRAAFEGKDTNGAPFYVHPLTNAGDGDSGDDKGRPLPKRNGLLPPPADVEVRDEVYRALLGDLTLDAHHLEELKLRGLTKAEIGDCGYATLRNNAGERRKVLQKLVKAFCEDVLLTVPGFVRDNSGAMAIAALPGLLIPVRNVDDLVVALKVKPEKKLEDGAKYLWMSSARRGGPSSGSHCHVPNVHKDRPDIVRITEGELKADIATRRGRMLCLSAPGVSNWSVALPTIKELGCHTVRVAFDADASVKALVALATVHCCRGLAGLGLNVEVERWAWSDGKGVDDILVSGKPIEVLTGDQVDAYLDELARGHKFPASRRQGIKGQEAPSPIDNGASSNGYHGPPRNGDGKHEESPPKRPRIVVTTDEHLVNDQAVAALAGDREIYTRGFALVTVQSCGGATRRFNRPPGSPRICEVPQAQLRERLTRQAEWVKERVDRGGEVFYVPVNPPDWSVAAVVARAVWPGIRPLEAVVESPILRPDGTVLDAPGYDEATGLVYRPNGRFPAVPVRPTLADAREAVAVLLDLVLEFPFETTAHQTAWLAAALTPLARFAISGPTPLFLLDATAPGSGKGLLADVIAVIATGRFMPRTAYPDGDEEMRKRITAVALAGDRLMLLDNVASSLGSAALDAALTGTTWRDRILGRSEMTAELPLLTTWYATANNITLRGDIVRRVIPIRLEPQVERPDEQTGFKYPRLLAHVAENRSALVSAGLTILRAYAAAGCPDQELTPFGSFEGWSDLVRSAIVWALGEDPCAVRKGLVDEDSETLARRALVEGWAELPDGKDGLAAAEAIRIVKNSKPEEYATLRELFTERGRNGEMITAKSLGHWLKSVEGRVIGRKSMRKRESGGLHRWFVKDQSPTS
jgi:hypothetical protein